MEAVAEIQPLLRWAGSKRKLVPVLSKYWHCDNDRYLEPFAGSACLYFKISPNTALLNDLNPHVINLYRRVRENPLEVRAIADSLPRDRVFYNRIRPLALQIKDLTFRAAVFLYLNRNCFNGLFRANLSGEFNVPFSNSRTGDLPKAKHFEGVSKKLKCAKLSTLDFEDFLLENVRQGDFVYLDPPYAIENERIFNQYGPATFGTSDLYRLEKCLSEIHRRKAKFVLSYADSRAAREMFSNWVIDDVSVKRTIASFAKHRRSVSELIITNIRTSYGVN